jgi:DNA-binding beta-propeller fold protein YncE
VQFDGTQFLMSQVGPEYMSYLRGGDGLLISWDGRIVDGESFEVIGQVEGVGAAVISSRESAIYNFAFEGNQAELRSFDIATQSLLWQTPASAHPQGVEGFEAGPELIAYRLADDRLMIVQKPRVETNAAADLEVTLGTVSTWRVGTIGTWDVTVQNLGGNAADGARLDLRLPVGFRAVQVNGAHVIADKTNHLVLNLGSIPANSGAMLRISAVPDRAYTSTEVIASVRSSAMDVNRSSNSTRLVHGVESSSLPNLLETLDIPGSDLVYDSVAKRLYVAGLSDNGILSSNLTVVDPVTGTATGSIELPGIPVKLAISGGSEFLYVALDGGARIVRYELPSLQSDLTIEIPVATWFQVDMFVPEGSPRTLVVSLHGAALPSPAGVWVYDDDEPRAKQIEGGWMGVTFIEPGATPDELIAVGDPTVSHITWRKYRITAEGLEFVSEREYTDSPFALEAAGNSTLVWPAEVYDSNTMERRGTLPTGFVRADFDPEAFALSQDGVHAVLAANVGMTVRFEGFRTDTITLSGVAEIPMMAPVRALALWEEDGVAALAGHSLVLGRLDLAAAPLEIRQYDATSLRVIFPSASGRRWVLQAAPTLNGPWSNVAEAISAGAVEVVPVNRAPDTNAFFRVGLQLEP